MGKQHMYICIYIYPLSSRPILIRVQAGTCGGIWPYPKEKALHSTVGAPHSTHET